MSKSRDTRDKNRKDNRRFNGNLEHDERHCLLCMVERYCLAKDLPLPSQEFEQEVLA